MLKLFLSLLCLIVFACEGCKEESIVGVTQDSSDSLSSSSSYVLKDTLPGIVDAGLKVRYSELEDSTSITDLKAFGQNLIASTVYGEFYVRVNGEWSNLKLPNNELGKGLHPIAIKDDNTVYLLGRLSLWEWSTSSGFKEVNLPDSSLWCVDRYRQGCEYRNLFYVNKKLIVSSMMGFVDSAGINNTYIAISDNEGLTWKETEGFPKITPNDDDIRNLTSDNNGDLWVATWERGIWYYKDNRWDSIPHYIHKVDSPSIEYPIIKYGGVANLNGEIYASGYSGSVNKIENSEKISLIAPTREYSLKTRNMTTAASGSYGLDTACGVLINNNSWAYWKPGMLDWKDIIDTTDSEFAFKATEQYPILIGETLASVRVGDTLYVSYTGGSKRTASDPHDGGVKIFNLRQARWCEEAWERGESWRDSIALEQKIRLEVVK